MKIRLDSTLSALKLSPCCKTLRAIQTWLPVSHRDDDNRRVSTSDDIATARFQLAELRRCRIRVQSAYGGQVIATSAS